MPNHVMNTISASGIGEFPIYSVEDGEKTFDFGKLVPMPKRIKIASQYNEPAGTPDGWYNWCRNNWGTKWNAYRCHIDKDEISFSSAWCPPEPVIRALAAKYPAKVFVHSYLNEGDMKTIYIDIYEHGEIAETHKIANPYYQTYLDKL